MKKRISILVVIVMLLFTGCGEELQTVLRFSDNTYEPQYTVYSGEADMSWTQNAEKVKDEFQAELNELGKDLCYYLNSEFDAGWGFGPIEGYEANVTDSMGKQTTTLTYGACYYADKIFVDESFIKNGLDNQARYIVAHELIHYLYRLNSKSDNFFAIYEGGMYCGRYLDEAIVDALARRYIIARHPEMKEDIYGGYPLIRLFVDLMQIEIPDTFQYFFRDDIEGLENTFDKHAEKYVVCEGSPFRKMVSMMDDITTVEGVQDDRTSAVVTFLTVTTSSEYAEQFARRLEEDGIDAEAFIPNMY